MNVDQPISFLQSSIVNMNKNMPGEGKKILDNVMRINKILKENPNIPLKEGEKIGSPT